MTGLVHSFCEEFVADAVIRRMISGPNWPRPGYLRDIIPPGVLAQLRALPGAAQIVRQLSRPDRDAEWLCLAARALARSSVAAADAISQLALTPAEIEQKWEDHRKTAAHQGTWMHYCFEAWLNWVAVPVDTTEMKLFLDFTRSLGGLTAYRTEWAIFAEEERLAGCIDFVAVRDDGALIIFDWKRTAKLCTKYCNRWRRMLPPLGHIDDCTGMQYRLQLNCYKYMLEKYYDKVVTDMWVACMHPDNGCAAFLDNVPSMPAETEALMRHQRHRAREVNAMANADFLGDPLGGMMEPEMSLDVMIDEELRQEDSLLESALPLAPPAPTSMSQTGPAAAASSAAGIAMAPSAVIAGGGSAGAVHGVPTASPKVHDTQADLAVDIDDPRDMAASRLLIPGASTSKETFHAHWQKMRAAYEELCSAHEPLPEGDSVSIVASTKGLHQLVSAACSEWPYHSEFLETVLVAALATYRMRLIDISIRERVQLLWVICGGRLLRAHAGTAFYYNDCLGCWEVFAGLLPERVYEEIRVCLLALEGLFRAFKGKVPRTDEGVLAAAREALAPFATEREACDAFRDNAIFNKGNSTIRFGRGRPPQAEQEGGDDIDIGAADGQVAHWNIYTAIAISRMSAQLQQELLGGKLIPYFIEWCSTDTAKVKGVAFLDCCIVYDRNGRHVEFCTGRSAKNNIYLGIRSAILGAEDPELTAAIQRVEESSEETFWAIPLAFKFEQACMALCKRGCLLSSTTLVLLPPPPPLLVARESGRALRGAVLPPRALESSE